MYDEIRTNENSYYKELFLIVGLILLALGYHYSKQQAPKKPTPQLSVDELMQLNFPEELKKKSKKKHILHKPPEHHNCKTEPFAYTPDVKPIILKPSDSNTQTQAKNLNPIVIPKNTKKHHEEHNKHNHHKSKKKTPCSTNINKGLCTDEEFNTWNKSVFPELKETHHLKINKTQILNLANFSTRNVQLFKIHFDLILAFIDQLPDILSLRETCKFTRDKIDRLDEKTNFSFFTPHLQKKYKFVYFVHPDDSFKFSAAFSSMLSLPRDSSFYEAGGFNPVLSKGSIISLFLVPTNFEFTTNSAVTDGFFKNKKTFKVTAREVWHEVPEKYLIATVELNKNNKPVNLNKNGNLYGAKILLSLKNNVTDAELQQSILENIEAWHEQCFDSVKNKCHNNKLQ